MNRRRARSVVLALLLISFVGPWGIVYHSDGPTRTSPLYFSRVVAGVLRRPLHWEALLIVAIMTVPIACVATIVAPQSRPSVIVYRVLVVGLAAFSAAALFVVAVIPHAPPLWEQLVEAWGRTLYVGALALALAVEAARRTPKRE